MPDTLRNEAAWASNGAHVPKNTPSALFLPYSFRDVPYVASSFNPYGFMDMVCLASSSAGIYLVARAAANVHDPECRWAVSYHGA
ncbi:MAG: hypothetical protein RL141_141 [Candidatus Parcubacteria bacterium]|jgi:hypothetical protein